MRPETARTFRPLAPTVGELLNLYTPGTTRQDRDSGALARATAEPASAPTLDMQGRMAFVLPIEPALAEVAGRVAHEQALTGPLIQDMGVKAAGAAMLEDWRTETVHLASVASAGRW